MIVSANSVPKNGVIQTNVCIVGAGAAGITLAREFIDQPFEVCLLESGGMSPNKRNRSLSMGENIGNAYRPLEYTRSRSFGGTTNVWHGGCEELDDIDFETRPWIPHSGWPFHKSHLRPFYVRARAICQLPSYAYDEGWESSFRSHLPLNSNRITQRVLYQSRSSHFGNLYSKELLSASNIAIYLKTNVTEIITNGNGNQVVHLRVSNFDGHEFFVKAQLFILATGGIENPRLLLASNRTHKEGLGNQYDLIGRFFMTHPVLDSGVLFHLGPSFQRDWYRYYKANTGYPKATIGLSQETQIEEKLLNLKATLYATYNEAQSDGVASLLFLLKEIYMVHRSYIPNDFGKHVKLIIKNLSSVVSYGLKSIVKPYSLTKKIEAFYLTNWPEPAPNPDSRVLLSTDRDELGVPRVKLDWRLSAIDKWSLRRSHEILAQQITSTGVGRLLIQLNKDENSWPPTLRGVAHHIGTTRMHGDPKQGVVDQNCEVHGISNLYIAGSSVFPTSGAVRPTLTIVALTLKLADHLKVRMKSTV